MASSKGTKKTTASKKPTQKATKEVSAKTTPSTKSNGKNLFANQLQLTLMALILIGVVVTFLFSVFTFVKVSEIDEKVTKLDEFFQLIAPQEYGSEAPSGQQPDNQQGSSEEVDMSQVDLSNVRSIGDENAPVTMIKYSDFRCSFCQRYDLETHDQIKEEYIDTGKVRFIYKDFPVVGGEGAANAAWCAEEQGNFWEFKDGLFELGPQMISDASMENLAQELGMDVDQYNECYSNQEYNDRVMAEMQEGQAFGMTGTPSFIINGEVLVGALPFSEFQNAIEAELS